MVPFEPKFTITPKIVRSIARIEAAKAAVESKETSLPRNK